EGMSPVLAGIVIGTVAAIASATVMKTLVFGVSPSDPLTLAAVAATLALVALIARLAPVYRAFSKVMGNLQQPASTRSPYATSLNDSGACGSAAFTTSSARSANTNSIS